MWQEVKAMCHSDGDWGPAHEEDRLGRYAGPGFDRVSDYVCARMMEIEYHHIK